MRSRSLPLLAAGVVFAAPLAAQEPAAAGQPGVHVVRPGDTLWDLAGQYLNDPYLWPEIYRINTTVVEDPARIYPRERLRIPGRDAAGWVPLRGPERTVFFQQEQAQSREGQHTIRAAGSAEVPVVASGDYYAAGLLVPLAELRPVARLEERPVAELKDVRSPSVTPTRLPRQIQLFDRVYLRAEPGARVAVGDRLHLLRAERALKGYGEVFLPTGIAEVEAVENGVATAVVQQMFAPMSPGDLAVPLPGFPVRAGVTPAPASGPDARIAGFANPRPLATLQDQLFLDVGAAAGIREGDDFEVYLPREAEEWGTRPEIAVARLQVIRVTPRTATARVTQLSQPALAAGLPVRRVGRMP